MALISFECMPVCPRKLGHADDGIGQSSDFALMINSNFVVLIKTSFMIRQSVSQSFSQKGGWVIQRVSGSGGRQGGTRGKRAAYSGSSLGFGSYSVQIARSGVQVPVKQFFVIAV